MKTKKMLLGLVLGVLTVAALSFIYFVGKDFGHFLAGLRTAADLGDVGYNVGYILGYLLIPILTLSLLYMTYKLVNRNT